MRSAYITVLIGILVVCAISPAQASHRRGDEPYGGPITKNFDSVDLWVPNKASGQVRSHLGRRQGDISRLELSASIRALPTEKGRIYRLWIVDDFLERGVLLKTFRSSKNGNANISARAHVRDIWAFDRFVVTLEPHRQQRRSASFARHGPEVLDAEQPLGQRD